MADQMERALAIAVVQADENVSLGNALFAAEWVIADLRRQLAETTNSYNRFANALDPMMRGFNEVIAEMDRELETIRRLEAMR